MAECPWCHGPVRDVRVPCPKCGKLASDLRTTDPPEPMPKNDAPPSIDIPDLVIPSMPASKSSMKPVGSVRPAPVPASSTEEDFALGAGADLQIDLSAAAPKHGIARPPTPGVGFSPFDDDISAGPSLELDTEGGGVPGRVSSPSMPSSHTSGTFSAPSPPVSHRNLAEAPVARPEGAATDPFEARALADYGPPPDAFWRAPMYAYRVVTRRGELRRALVQTKDESERMTKRALDALVAFGEKARTLGKDGPLLERVREAEALLRSRDGALAGAMDSHRAALSDIDTRLGVADMDLKRARDEEARAQAALEAADADAKRADAKLKRVDIEIRNGATARAAEREPLAADLAQKTQERGAAEHALAEARRAASAMQARQAAVAEERASQEQRFSRQAGTRGAGVDDAQKQLRSALAELGRAMLSDASLAHLAAAREEVAQLEAQAHAKTHSVALHEAAITSFDAGKVVIGFVLVLVALLLLVLLLFFPFIYRAFAV